MPGQGGKGEAGGKASGAGAAASGGGKKIIEVIGEDKKDR